MADINNWVVSLKTDENFSEGEIYKAGLIYNNLIQVTGNDKTKMIVIGLDDSDFIIILNPNRIMKKMLTDKFILHQY
jgi:hypothetical protein